MKYDSATVIMLHMNSTLTVDDINSTWMEDNEVVSDPAVYKFGGSSGKFTTAGKDMLTNARAPFNMGTGDFTVEGWVNFLNFTNTDNYFISAGYDGTNQLNLFDVKYSASPNKYWAFCDNGVCNNFGDIPGNTTTNQWYAFAVSRVSGVDYFYVNGNLIGSHPDTTNIAIGGNMEEIGSVSTAKGFIGHLDEIRVTKGLGRYSGPYYTLQTTEFGLSGGGAAPIAGFTINKTSGYAPLTVGFTDTSINTRPHGRGVSPMSAGTIPR